MTSGLRIQSVNGNIELIPKEDLLLSPVFGKVGIGTSDPTYNLHVAGTGVTRFLVQSTDNDQASFDL